jgi:hypothetical protein
MKTICFTDPAALRSNRLFKWLKTATITSAIRPCRLPAALGIAGILLFAAMSGNAFAAKKVCDDGSRPPCRDTGELAGNRLSYPAVTFSGSDIVPFYDVAEGVLGETWSYGCEGEEVLDDQYTYPNTSCVNSLTEPTTYFTADTCVSKCGEQLVDRIYWQKQEANSWSSQVTVAEVPVFVRYVDWGDSIEVLSWNENSILRVETQPFVDLAQDPLVIVRDAVEVTVTQQLGFQMWHVAGQGITEQWGVRTTEDESGFQGLPYAYQSPYAIINAGTADLYLSKLFRAAADDTTYACPEGSGDTPPVYPPGYFPDPDPNVDPFWVTFKEEGGTFATGTGWSEACNLDVVGYTVEQSVGGKFVHGYNWSMRDLPDLLACDDGPWQKTGWWRLTFVPNGGVEKMLFDATTVTSAPVVPEAVPTDLLSLAEDESEEETDEGSLYTPVIDEANNLTYIDICIVKKVQGGGGGKRDK